LSLAVCSRRDEGMWGRRQEGMKGSGEEGMKGTLYLMQGCVFTGSQIMV